MACTGLTSVIIPEGVTAIGKAAFRACTALTSVTIPEGVTTIENNTFMDCSSLTSVIIPEGVTAIGSYAFQSCSSLASVTIPEGVTTIGSYAFQSCTGLASIAIPGGVTTIGISAFSNCTGLTSVNISEGVTTIDKYAFAYCTKLVSVIIPDSIETIEATAFSGSDNLSSVYYAGTEEQWSSVSVGDNALGSAEIIYEHTHTPSETATYEYYNANEHKTTLTCTGCNIGISNLIEAHSGGSAATCVSKTVCDFCESEYGEYDYTNHVGENANGEYCDSCIYSEASLVGGVYQIGNDRQLLWFADHVNNGNTTANAVLTADIDLEGLAFWKVMDSYGGTFDGAGYSIIGMNRNAGLADNYRQGFICNLVSGGTVKNLTFKNASVFVQSEIGSGVIAYNNAGTISGCMVVDSDIQLGNYSGLGLIAGKNLSGGVIENCGASGSSITRRYSGSGSQTMGGITQINNGTVQNCFTYGCSFNNGTSANSAIVASGNAPTNCYYYTASTVATTYGTAKSVEEFSSGEVAYLLQGDQTEQVWGQNIDNGETAETVPTLSNAGVYKKFKCDGVTVVYSNSEDNVVHIGVYDENGFCTGCGNEYESSVEVTAENYESLGLTEDYIGYYAIENAGQLYSFAETVNGSNKSANAVLLADIDLEGRDWTIICETGLYYSSYGSDLGYAGTFDGMGHVIKNVKVTSSATMDASAGLFGTVSGTVMNLGIEGFTFVDGGKDIRAGAIVGQLIKSTGKISNCYVKNAVINPGAHVTGGIAGCVYEGTIENCYVVNSTISGTSGRYGYIVGDSRADGSSTDRRGTVTNCYTDNSTAYSSRTGFITSCETVTTERFASGEIAYKLGAAFGQNMDNGETVQSYPVLGGATVYEVPYCDGTLVYSNEYEEITDHTWGDDNICDICGHTISAADPIVDIGRNGNLVLSEENSVKYYSVNGGEVRIPYTGKITVKGSSTVNTVTVESGTHNVVLNGVNIDVSGIDGAIAFSVSGGTADIILTGENTLKGGAGDLHISSGESVTIDGTGSLTASLTGSSAEQNNITVNDGTINGDISIGYGDISIIGGTVNGDITNSSGDVNISGGIINTDFVTAVSGTVKISGGTLIASGTDYGISGSDGIVITGGNVYVSGTLSAIPTDGNGNAVALKTVTLDGIGTGVKVDAIEGVTDYGMNDVYTIDGKLYIYLPEASVPTAFIAEGKQYADPDGDMTYTAMTAETDPAFTLDGTVTYTLSEEYGVKYYTPSDGTKTVYSGTFTVSGTADTVNTAYLTVVSGEHDIVLKDSSLKTDETAPISITGGCANIILVGNNILEGMPGIYVAGGASLVVDGTGSLNASGYDYDAAGIGGMISASVGSITIAGGNITATGGTYAAGIGSGDHGTAESITITGGTVIATGGTFAAGIGSGSDGKVNSIKITGGTITATGDYTNAGIGGIFDSIEISGGNITAKTDGSYGAGIGGRFNRSVGSISITGGTITATGGSGAYDIGAGDDGSVESVTITGGNVYATLYGISPAPTDGKGNSVSLKTISNVTNELEIASIDGITDYGFDDVYAINGKLYLYLPSNITAGSITYAGGATDSGEAVTLNIADGSIVLSETDGTKYYKVGDGDAVAYIGTITITGSDSTVNYNDVANTVTVESGTHYVILSDLIVNAYTEYYSVFYQTQISPFTVAAGAAVNITLVGENMLAAGRYHAGIEVPTGASVTINGTGSLTVTGGDDGAGIGGGDAMNCGNVTVNGGTVIATGGPDGAGIGGGDEGYIEGVITITGGVVTATGGNYGDGIGGGYGKASKNDLIISGGTVKSTAGNAYYYGITAGNITVTGGNIYASSVNARNITNGSVAVSLVELTVTGSDSEPVTSINGITGYGLTDVYPIGGKLYIYLADDNYDTAVTSSIIGAALRLGADLTMNYYATVSGDHHANVRMQFTVNGNVTLVEGVCNAAMDRWDFLLEGITPQCMGDNIKAELVLVDANGNVTEVLDTKAEYSVREYCNNILQSYPTDMELRTLIEDLLEYGAAAQEYRNYKTDELVNAGNFGASGWNGLTETDKAITESTSETVYFTAAGVWFDYVNRLYFKVQADDISTVTVKIGDVEYTAANGGLTLVEGMDSIYILYTDPIYATAFDSIYTVELAVDGTTVQTVTYSLKSYVYTKQDQTDESGELTEMAKLSRAIYNYGMSAKAYAEKINQAGEEA